MRFLAWHVDYVTATPTEKGRSQIIESAALIHAENTILVFASFEKSDENQEETIIDRSVNEISSIAVQLNVTSIVLNPFAHLFAEQSSPETAKRMLDLLYNALLKKGFNVQKMAFGMFYELELRTKGHRLSRIARRIN
ncbi:MAG: hypothetical protein LVQ95_05130 [Candidatus Micrarchaeales archaeon]|nr:hypothetical protein [Candidatus Micrarchaeales archaeon]